MRREGEGEEEKEKKSLLNLLWEATAVEVEVGVDGRRVGGGDELHCCCLLGLVNHEGEAMVWGKRCKVLFLWLRTILFMTSFPVISSGRWFSKLTRLIVVKVQGLNKRKGQENQPNITTL